MMVAGFDVENKILREERKKKIRTIILCEGSIDRLEYCDIDSEIAIFSKVLCHGGLKY